MRDSKFVGWTAFGLFALAEVVMVVLVLSPTIDRYDIVSPEIALWVVGALALLATPTGFLAFQRPQGKIAAVGGLLLLVAILWITPVSFGISAGAPTNVR